MHPLKSQEKTWALLELSLKNSALEEDVLKEKLAGFTLELFPSRDALQEKVLDGTMDSGYIVTSPSSYTAVVKNISMFTGGDFLDEVLRSYNEDLALEKKAKQPFLKSKKSSRASASSVQKKSSGKIPRTTTMWFMCSSSYSL